MKSGASFGTFETVLSDWLRCIVPPPVSNANEDVSSPVSGVSGVSPSSASYTAFTFHVSSFMRSVTSRLSRTIPDTVCDAAFDRAAASASSSLSAPNTRYGISISVTSPLALTVWSRSEYASSTLVAAMFQPHWNVIEPPPSMPLRSSAAFFVCFSISCVAVSILCSIWLPRRADAALA